MNQRDKVLSILEGATDHATARDFVEAGIFNYTGRISELRDRGYVIEAERISKNHFKYRLASSPCEPAEGAEAVVADTPHPRADDLPESLPLPSGDRSPTLFVCDLNDSPYY